MVPRDRVKSLQPTDDLRKAAQVLVTNNISSVVVLDKDQVVGLLTKTDMLAAYVKGIDLSTKVDELMTRDIVYANVDMSTPDIADLMNYRKKHHVLVQNKEGKFVGLVSSQDVVRETALDARAIASEV